MKFLTITQAQAERLAAVQSKQDHNAFALGVLEWEFEKALKRLVCIKGDEAVFKLTLGALHWEHANKRKFFLETIERTEAEQRTTGEDILREFGLDVEANDYSLYEGRVLKLQSGQWQPVPQPTVN